MNWSSQPGGVVNWSSRQWSTDVRTLDCNKLSTCTNMLIGSVFLLACYLRVWLLYWSNFLQGLSWSLARVGMFTLKEYTGCGNKWRRPWVHTRRGEPSGHKNRLIARDTIIYIYIYFRTLSGRRTKDSGGEEYEWPDSRCPHMSTLITPFP